MSKYVDIARKRPNHEVQPCTKKGDMRNNYLQIALYETSDAQTKKSCHRGLEPTMQNIGGGGGGLGWGDAKYNLSHFQDLC